MAEKGWKSYSAEAVAISDFVHSDAPRYLLRFSVGDVIQVVETMEGWYKGILIETKETGLFPASFFRVKPSEDGKDPIMRELHSVFREWGDLLKKLYLARKTKDFNILSERLKTLFSWNKDALAKMKAKVMASIEEGRRLMGLDLLVRTNTGEIATERNCSIMELYRMHQEQDQRSVLSNVVPRLRRKENAFAQGGSLIDQKVEFMLPLHHIMLQFVVFQCKVTDPTELRFSIYNAHSKTFITEEYPLLLTIHGLPADIGRINKLKTIFTDIDDKDLADGKLHLVCYLVRVGQMHADKATKGQKVRRPYACAAMKLTTARILDEASRGVLKLNLKNLDEVYGARDPAGKLVEQRMMIFNTPQESSFPDIHELIIKNANVVEVPKSLGITIGLKLLLGEYPSLLQRAPHLKEITVAQRLSVQPGHCRNDYYITIDSGEFTQDRKRAAKNVEISVTVRDGKGNDVQDVLISGAGEMPVREWKSIVYYHNNTPKWNETFKLLIAPHKFRDYHLYFTMRHCTTSGKTNTQKAGAAYCFLRLTDFAGSIQRDGEHVLSTYKPQKADDPVYYLRDPQKVIQRKGEFLKIRTSLCSTHLTQHPGLLGLLNWQSHNRNELPELLRHITFVERPEMMKFLRPTFEAMFNMLHRSAGDEKLQFLVYDALIFVLGMFAEDRMLLFVNFRPTINSMIQAYEQYDPAKATPEEKERLEVFTHVHLYLVPCVKRCFEGIDQPGSNITSTLKVRFLKIGALEYTMKFIIVSRILHIKHTGSPAIKDDTFKNDMIDFFDRFTALMKRNSPSLIGAQTLALKNIVLWFQGLLLLFTEMELATVVHKVIATLSYSDKKQFNQTKLALLKEIVSSQLFIGEQARYILIPAVMEQLRLFMASSHNPDEKAEIITIVCWIVDVMDDLEDVAVVKYLLLLLADVLHLVESVENPCLKLDAAMCLLGFFHLVKQADFTAYLDNMASEKRESLLMRMVTTLDQLIVRPDIIPCTWLGVSMFQYGTTSKVIAMICEHLKPVRGDPSEPAAYQDRQYLDGSSPIERFHRCQASRHGSADTEVPPEFMMWVKLVKLMIAFLTSRVLGVEKFSAAKAQIMREGHGDMRTAVCGYLCEIWETLGPLQIRIIPALVAPLLELLTVPNKELNETGMNIYFSMLKREFEYYKSFKRVERQTIGSLDKIVNEYDEKHQQNLLQFFLSSLRQRFDTAPEMQEVAEKFMADMKTLITLFTSLRTLPLGPEYDDERTLATLKLMEYLKSTGRIEQYIEYAYQLYERHLGADHFIEAGFTLLLQAQLLDWSDTIVPAIPSRDLAQETSYERREALYKEAISLFTRGKYWEKAIELLEELRHQYQHVTCEFVLLADILQSEAALYRLIVTGERFFTEYFRVGYYGMGFPVDVRNKQFVHRGVEFQRRDAFEALIMKRWPSAVIMNTTEPPSAEIKNSPGQHLQIYAIKMASAEEARGEHTRLQIAHSNNRRYKTFESVSAFLYARPEDRRQSKNDNEFANLWIMNYYFTSEEAFPGVVRRSEIVSVSTSELSPIDNAIINIVDKNMELEKMIETFSVPGGSGNVSPFTMVLKGVIDAAVNGGVMRYEQAFLNNGYAEEHPDHADKVDLLRSVLDQQIAVLDRGLKVHQMVVPPEMADLQNQLQIGLMKLKRRTQKVGEEVGRQLNSHNAAFLASAMYGTDLAKFALSDVAATRKLPAMVAPLNKPSPGVVSPRTIMSSAAPPPKKLLPTPEPRAHSFALQDPAYRSLTAPGRHAPAFAHLIG
ncbi:SH3 domain containing protein [Acanthamoeba castellanii str. Neff]|uniref:SH3 domain containing protein n=1 Tax=Acanthamoeba castellanii (strain ATCC 30010 / Neff) TaxID=1257118 RepID=L8HFM1_ACACF|nr:SH3 domain containing protein [Acanthamoeba castellanii str. Neff]ELR23221.1 SH3 domain containing protein [Acanthamoeba castellanii str. Neff]